MWQKCPICNGEGRVTANGYTSSVFEQCSVCNGMKIISEVTGLPPSFTSDMENKYFREDSPYQEYFDSPIMLKKC